MKYWSHELRLKAEELTLEADKAKAAGDDEKACMLYAQAAEVTEQLIAIVSDDAPKFKLLLVSSAKTLRGRVKQ